MFVHVWVLPHVLLLDIQTCRCKAYKCDLGDKNTDKGISFVFLCFLFFLERMASQLVHMLNRFGFNSLQNSLKIKIWFTSCRVSALRMHHFRILHVWVLRYVHYLTAVWKRTIHTPPYFTHSLKILYRHCQKPLTYRSRAGEETLLT